MRSLGIGSEALGQGSADRLAGMSLLRAKRGSEPPSSRNGADSMKRILAFAASAVALSGCTTAQAPPVIATQTVIASDDRAAPDTMRWLYGSGEAAGVSIQTWRQISVDSQDLKDTHGTDLVKNRASCSRAVA